MNLQDLLNKHNELQNKILQAELELRSFENDNLNEFHSLLSEQQQKDKEWFVKNFDYIWKHKDRFKNAEPFRSILIDFFNVYECSGFAGAAFSTRHNRFFLGSLIDLWENGFTYNDKPIMEYKMYIHQGMKLFVTYIDNNELHEERIPNDILSKEMKDRIFGQHLSKNSYGLWERYKRVSMFEKKDED